MVAARQQLGRWCDNVNLKTANYFLIVSSGTSTEKKIQNLVDPHCGQQCVLGLSYEVQELRDLGTKPEGDCSNSEDCDDCQFGGPDNHQNNTINKPHGPMTIVLNAVSNVSCAQSEN